MLGYVERILTQLIINILSQPQHSPHAHIHPHSGAEIQFTDTAGNFEPLSADIIHTVQDTIWTILYYERAVDSKLLVALGTFG